MKRRAGVRVGAVATDLDGTLLATGGIVSAATAAAVARLRDRAIPFVIATARSVHGVRGVAEELGATGHVVCSNGAVVWDAATDAVVEEQRISRDIAVDVVDRVRAAIPEVGFGIYCAERWHGDERFAALRPLGTAGGSIVATPSEVGESQVHLVTFRHADADHDALAERIREHLPDGLACYPFTGGVDIALSGVTKGTAVARVVAGLGVRREDVVAFGDMPNDLAMLEWAGWACAVANAHPTVLAVADEVVGSNDDDGVARWVERALSH